MANAAIAYRNLADAGTITASSAEAEMPVSRLQNEHVGKRWRSSAEPAWFVCDLLSHASFDTLALLGLSAGATSTIRVRVSSDNDEYTRVLLHMDGADASTTFTDSAAGATATHTWTASGNAQIDTAASKFGGASGLFDGTTDYISTPDHADLSLGSGDWTIDGWFRCEAAGGTNRGMICHSDASLTAAGTAIYLRRDTINRIVVSVSNGSGFAIVAGTTEFTDALNTGWHHFAVVRTGDELRLFVDGTEEGSSAFTGSVPDVSETLYVGAFRGGALSWQGWLDEIRISVGIARWTSSFTPPLAAADGTGAAGDLYDVTFDASDAEYDPTLQDGYGMLVALLDAPITGRFVRFDITDTPASYVEAGRLFVGLREAFAYNFAPGAGIRWEDRSRKTESAGGQTLIFADNKFRVAELNFEWVTEAQRWGLVERIDRLNGQSVDVLLCLDTEADDLPAVTIFGLINAPAANLYTNLTGIFARAYQVKERL